MAGGMRTVLSPHARIGNSKAGPFHSSWPGVVLVLLVVSFIYAPALDYPFHFDDIHSIVDNPHIRSLRSIPAHFASGATFSREPSGAMYRPLVLVSYAFNHAWSGYEIWSYRAVNIAVHAANGLLVVALLRVMGLCGWAAVAGASLFLLHPVNVEAVVYISSRSESMCAAGFLFSLLAYEKAFRATGRSRIGWRAASLAGFGASLLSKSVGIALLPVLLARELLASERVGSGRFGVRGGAAGGHATGAQPGDPRGGWEAVSGADDRLTAFAALFGSLAHPLRSVLRHQWPYWLVALPYLIGMRYLIDAALISHPVRSLSVQLLTQLKALVYYTLMLIMPVRLTVEHAFSLASGWQEPAVVLSGGLLLSMSLLGVGMLRRRFAGRRGTGFGAFPDHAGCTPYGPPLPVETGERPAHPGKELGSSNLSGGHSAFWLVFPLLVLLPTLVVPLNVLVNEHRLYLPTVALAALMALAVGKMPRHHGSGRRMVAALAVWLLTASVLTSQRTAVWASVESLWQDALVKAATMPRPHIYVGDEQARNGRLAKALRAYRQALTVNPLLLTARERVVVHNNTGAVLLSAGDYVAAVEHYQQALQLDPGYALAQEGLEAAAARLQREHSPEADRLRQLGLKLMVDAQLDEAITHLRQALRLQSDPQTWMALAMAYERQGANEQAARTYAVLANLARGQPYAETALRRLQVLGRDE